MRRLRVRRLPRVRLQVAFKTIACNLKRWQRVSSPRSAGERRRDRAERREGVRAFPGTRYEMPANHRAVERGFPCAWWSNTPACAQAGDRRRASGKRAGRGSEARVDNLIVCTDAERNCADGELPAHARIIRYRERIDPADVLALVES